MHWIHYPANKEDRFAPWYTITRRLLFFIPLYLCRVSLFLVVLCGWGKWAATQVWKDTK